MTMTLEEFQAAANKRKTAKGRKPVPYTEEQRKFAVAFARKALEAGTRKSEILKKLGITTGTLESWMVPEKVEVRRKFRRVRLTPDRKGSGSLTLVTPRGYRVEGLGLAEAAELLRAIG
jgi:transposase